jgi:uncharacterized protein (TIGR03437 family)
MALKPILTKLLHSFACLAAPVLLFAQGPQFTIQDLGTLPNLPACSGTALSQSGNVVGYCTGAPGENLLIAIPAPTTHVFLYSKGVMTDLNVTSPTTAFPTGVNDSGVVVGGAVAVNLLAETASAAPFIYENGSVQSGSGQIQSALPLAVNNSGQMVATSLQVAGGNFNFFVSSQAFLDPLSGGTVTQLESPSSGGSAAAFGINSTGLVAGASVAQNAEVIKPLLWQNDTPQPLPLLSGYANALASSVNDSGVAAGVAFTIDFTKLTDTHAIGHAVLFNTNGTITDLGVLPGDVSSAASSINNSGSVVGFSSNAPPTFGVQLTAYFSSPASKYHAFIYSGGTVYNLTSQLVNGAGWQLSFATQINNAGQIVGSGLINGAQHAFLLTPVTGPSVGNIVGAAFSTPGVKNLSSNGVFTIFGSALAASAQGDGTLVDNQLPTNLGGTCVESGGTKWNLFYVSPGQLNVLAGDVPTSGTVPVQVITNCGTSNEVASAAVNVPVGAVSPEFLYFLETSTGQNPVAAVEATTNAYVGTPGLIPGATFAPAHAGDVLTAYGVGWGPTSPAVSIGTLAAGAAQLTSSYSLTLGGKTAAISYIGLSPDSAGLYQVNFTVPAGLSGNQPLVLTVDGVTTTSNAFIPIAD